MSVDQSIDLVALYAAVVATTLAILEIYKFLTNGPSIFLQLFDPTNMGRFTQGNVELVANNIGTTPVVIESIAISMYESRSGAGPLEEILFNNESVWNPSVRSVPHPTKANTSTLEAHVIPVGGEVHHLIKPFANYDPTKHWLMAEVKLRAVSKRYRVWAPPPSVRAIPFGPSAGTLLMAIGVFHEVAGIGLYAQPLGDILRGGVWNTVMPDFGAQHAMKQAAFWFMVAGPLAMMLGALANWAEARGAGPLPAWLGWALIGFTILGVVPFPISGFWLFLVPAFLILRRDRQ